MIIRVHSRWVIPVAAPVLRDGWIDVDSARGEIVGLGAARSAPQPGPDAVLDLGDAVVLPGLVNAHTHLELSHLAGAVAPADSFVSWVRAMLGVRFGSSASVADVTAAVVRAIGQMEATGTAGVGDIGNTDVAVLPLAASSLSGVHFREALGLKRADAARIGGETRLGAALAQTRLTEQRSTRLVASVAPHAPYSTSAPLIQSLAAGYEATGAVSSIHLAESPEELEFLASGTGPFRALLTDLGAWDDTWVPPGLAPVPYLQQLGALHARLLVVHGTQLGAGELRTLADVGATVVLCPRSNRWVGAGVPPVAAAFAAGVRVAVGTDSLASVEDLNLFAELAFLRRIAPDVPAAALLAAATRGGAQALRREGLGVLAPGATSHAIVRVPPTGIADVEQWLVADAADTGDLRWLDELVAHAAS
ncbi:Atrazine chlorohydrolase [Luteitalea pratensis]|uniref:Atrazine chlorohydrolase n=1 Tax=Luteitalea pratensis TaxID=1855912 RepID=A0A143PRF6_LUTPR|nr:amidohydrolase family protein [Luteitalea pratensis]AMY11192.1 Atrazine chlorohydrolase [Luteitalea pratensis]